MTQPHLHFGILTRGRPNRLRRCLQSILATTAPDLSLQITVAFDDDLTGYRSLEPYVATNKVLLTPRHYYVRGVNALFTAMKQKARGELDYFVLLNDDVEFIVPGWAPQALETLHEQYEDGMGVLELADSGKCAHYLSRAAFFDDAFGGRLAHPSYTMYFSDSELMNRLKAADRYGTLFFNTDQNKTRHSRCLIHAETEDSVSADVHDWFQRDNVIYNERAQEFGWDEKEADEND